MKKIFWGFVIIIAYININFGGDITFTDGMFTVTETSKMSLRIFPHFVGWLVVYSGIKELDSKYSIYSRIITPTIVMVVLQSIVFLFELFNLADFLLIQRLISIVSLILMVLIEYGIIKGYGELELKLEKDFKSEILMSSLKTTYTIEIIIIFLSIIVAIFQPMVAAIFAVTAVILSIVVFVIRIKMLINYNRAAKNY